VFRYIDYIGLLKPGPHKPINPNLVKLLHEIAKEHSRSMPFKILLPNNRLEHVRQEIQDLAKRGNVTFEEYQALKCNSYEWEHILPHLTDEAFVHAAEHAIGNCHYQKSFPWRSYNEAVMGFYAPELVRRMKKLISSDKKDA